MKMRARRKLLSRRRAKRGERPVPSAANIRATMRRIYEKDRLLFERLADS